MNEYKLTTCIEQICSNLYPWRHGKSTEYSTPQTHLADEVLSNANAGTNDKKSFSGELSKFPSEGTLYLEMCVKHDVDPTKQVWVRIGRFDKQGILQSMYDQDVVLGSVNPNQRSYVVAFAKDAPKKALRMSYRMDIQKNIPFGGTGNPAQDYPDHHNRFGQTFNTLNFNITRIPVEAKTRKLGANYSFELIEDYQAEFGEKFEDRMIDYLKQTILTEIDGEIIDLLFGAAHYVDSWSCEPPSIWSRGINAWYVKNASELSNKFAA